MPLAVLETALCLQNTKLCHFKQCRLLGVQKCSPTQLPTLSFPFTDFAYPMFVEIPVAIKNKRSVHRLDEKEQQKVVCVHIGGGGADCRV